MTSGGNLNPANADLGGWMGRMSRWYFTARASFIKGQSTSTKAAGRGALNATVPIFGTHRLSCRSLDPAACNQNAKTPPSEATSQ